MKLYDICMDIAGIGEGLAFGDIDFVYDNLMCVVKPGHPADLLDEIYCVIGSEVILNPDTKIATPRLKEMLKELKSFKSAFKVKELAKPIRELTAFIKEQEADENGVG